MTLISTSALLLDEVARTGSIRKAAERLNISPSALNRRVLNLEADYGVKLFERLPRGVRLTAAGELLINDIRRWRADHERLQVQLQEMQGLRRGHVTIGIMECLAGSFAQTLFDEVQSRFRGLTLELFVGGTRQLLQRLMAGELNMVVCFNAPPQPDLTKLLSFDVPAGIVIAPGHPLAGKSAVRLSECLEYPLILPDFSLATRSLIDRAMASVSASPVPSAVTNSTRLMKQLVRDGRHIAFLGVVDLLDEINEGSLTFVPLSDGRLPQEALALVIRNSQPTTPAVAALQNLLRSQLLALPLPSVEAE